MSPPAQIVSVQPVIGLEIHVELACRTKMFSRAPSIAHADHFDAPPNTCIDPVVLALPGALPVLNAGAVEMAARVGLALGCQIATVSRWDRKSYFYPDLPKGYQISQYDLPLCFDGSVDLPAPVPEQRGGQIRIDPDAPTTRIGIIRAHLEEDAGKLLHEAPGGGKLDYSIADYNRAGTALLEIVTQPDFTSADQVVLFCQTLRNICRFLGASEGVLQKGHMRFEPNINCHLTLEGGRVVKTPIVEVKNLNSWRAVKGAIEHELREQPGRWLTDGRELGPGTKQTRGWDDRHLVTLVQREKEDAHDYRYFPDPDLLPVTIARDWVERVRGSIPELPAARRQRYCADYALSPAEAQALVDERDVCFFYEDVLGACEQLGVPRTHAGKPAANLLLQSGAKRANERTAQFRSAIEGAQDEGDGAGVLVSELGITPASVAGIVALRHEGALSAGRADELFGLLCSPEHRAADPRVLAQQLGMLLIRDDGAVDRWCDEAIAQQPQAATDVRAGKDQAIGRLVGAAMKASAGQGDAAGLRERLLKKLRG